MTFDEQLRRAEKMARNSKTLIIGESSFELWIPHQPVIPSNDQPKKPEFVEVNAYVHYVGVAGIDLASYPKYGFTLDQVEHRSEN